MAYLSVTWLHQITLTVMGRPARSFLLLATSTCQEHDGPVSPKRITDIT